MAKLHPFAAGGNLTETSITASATSLTEASMSGLPVVAAPDIIELVFDPFNVYGHRERLQVTAHASGSSTVTVVRGAYGSTASVHNTGGAQEQWLCAPTDQDLIHANLATLNTDDHQQYLLVSGARAMTGTLTIPTLTGSTSPLVISDAVTVTGALIAQSSLAVQGATSLAALAAGATAVTGTLSVSSTSTLAGTNITGTLAVTGNETVSGTLSVGNTLNANGGLNANNGLSVSDGTSTDSLSVTNNSSIGNNLTVGNNFSAAGVISGGGPAGQPIFSASYGGQYHTVDFGWESNGAKLVIVVDGGNLIRYISTTSS
jgi:hypothetical protein